MSLFDDVGVELPTDDMLVNWREADDYRHEGDDLQDEGAEYDED